MGGNDVLDFDLASGKPIRTLAGHHGPVDSVAVSPDGKLLASGGWDGTAMIWNALTGKPMRTLAFPSLRKKLKNEDDEDLIWVQSVAFSPDGRTLAAAAKGELESAAVEVWDVATAKSKVTLKKIDPEIRQLVFSPTGKTMVTVGTEIKLWDTTTFKESGAIHGCCWPIALSPDGKTVAATGGERTVVILKTETLDAIRR
jgi:WD40 repeat protein